jgi:subtilase family serine protease
MRFRPLLTMLAVALPATAFGAAPLSGDASGSPTAVVPVTCTMPDGTVRHGLHCYTPQQIRAAYGVDSVPALKSGAPNYGQGQTIVLVDAYGSPTATADLQAFHDQFFPTLPNPKFEQIFPQGDPQYHNVCHSAGLSGSCAAAGWSGEATLDIEWAYSIAPEANIILLAVPPAETEGVQGFPNLFNAISGEVAATPPGTMFSMSFAVTEQTFGGAAAVQTARFDQVFHQAEMTKNDQFFGATGDTGSLNVSKQHEESVPYSQPTIEWPASSPYVTAVGGTQLQYGWTWDPSSDNPFLPGYSLANASTHTGKGLNPDYWFSTKSGDSQAVWNESFESIGGGGGASAIYPRPSWQAGVGSQYGNHRLVPDTAWNAAVNGGVMVWISAYPAYNCPPTLPTGCWADYGGTSAATPQTAALVALANAARADAGEAPLPFLDPILYQDGVGSSDYTDITAQHYGSAPKTFAGSEVGVSGPVLKSVGDLQDNQMWPAPGQTTTPAGYATTSGWDASTGWGAPNASAFVTALLSI